MKTGIAYLALHYGKTPPWLFGLMKELAREIVLIIRQEFAPEEFLKRVADPFWFQAFGCVLGYDWHSSGVTTVVCGALKEGLKPLECDLGIFVAGGKGRASRKTPQEIENSSKFLKTGPQALIYASKMVAKVDSACLQDGYSLYHHCFIFTKGGSWTVIQQGMNIQTGYARRYHWLSQDLRDFICEPHKAICCDYKTKALNLVASESEGVRKIITSLSGENPETTIKELQEIQSLTLPGQHDLNWYRWDLARLKKVLLKSYEQPPQNFEELLQIKGVGPKTLRALSLISELIYGEAPSWRDPVKFSFSHGGKDGEPYPVDKTTYNQSIFILEKAINKAKLGDYEKLRALRRLAKFTEGV